MKQRKIRISEFKIDKKSLDEVMDKFKEIFGPGIKMEEGSSYKSIKDVIRELENEDNEEEDLEEDENYNIDEVIGELIEENQTLKVRLSNIEEKVRNLNKAVLTLARAAEPCECKKAEKENE